MRSNRIIKVLVASVILAAVLTLTTALYASGQANRPAATYFKAPLRFEPNKGQSAPGVDFVSHGKGFTLRLSPTQALFALPHEQLRMELAGADGTAQPVSHDPLSSKVNYFLGADPSKWRTNIPTYGKARFRNVYPGIDVVYYGNGEQLEYDFVVSPGADPAQIALQFPEARRLRVDENGNLLVTGQYGTLTFRRPIVYQDIKGRRRNISGNYAITDDDRVAFHVASYDPSRPLIIDPVLVFSVYLGGTNLDQVLGIAADASSNSYVTGLTQSLDFLTATQSLNVRGIPTPYQSTLTGYTAAFVTKLNSSGGILYTTFLGGTDQGMNTQANAITIDSAGNVYIAGRTDSNALPTKGGNGIQLQKSGVGPVTSYKSLLGGSGYLNGSHRITTSSNPALSGGNGTGLDVTVIVSGGSVTAVQINNGGIGYSINNTITVPGGTTHATFQVAATGQANGFVAELNTNGGLINSTYVGGNGVNGNPLDTTCSGGDEVHGIALDQSNGNVYVTGFTDSSQMANLPAFGAPVCQGAFALGLNFNATGIFKFATLIGGDGQDSGNGVAVDNAHNVYVTGSMNTSSDRISRNDDVFLAKLDASGNTVFSTVTVGGSGFDGGNGIAVDSLGNAYVAGQTNSASGPFLTPNAKQSSFASTSPSDRDALILKFASNGALVYGSYLGGSGDDIASGIALDGQGNVSIIGSTVSTDLPLVNPLVSTGVNGAVHAGGVDAFVARFNSTFATEFYASYLGGTNNDFGIGLAVAPTTAVNNTFIGGWTTSTDFPKTVNLKNNNTQNTGFVALISEANPGQLKFNAALPSAPAGFAMPSFQVSILDSNNNVVTSSTSAVAISIQSGPAGGSLTGTTTVNAAAGIATFSGIALGLPGSYTLQATDSADNLNPAQATLTITQPVLCFTVPPVTTVANAVVPDFKVALQSGDCSGNIINASGINVTVSITGGPAAPASISSSTTAGVATFSGLTLAAGNYTPTASANGFTPANSSLTIIAPGASMLCFTPVSLGPVSVGSPIPDFQVAVSTSCPGTVVPMNDTISLTITSGPAGGTLSGTSTVTTSTGIALFHGLTLNTAGTYQLTATSSHGATPATATITVKKQTVSGIYVTSASCNALTMSGNAYTDGFDSGLGSYAATRSNTWGDISVAGSSDLDGNATINGVLYTTHPTAGDCRKGNGVDLSGHARATGGYQPLTPVTFTPAPAVPPGTSDIDVKSKQTVTLSAGNYRDIKLSGHGVLTLSPGVYNINSLSLTGASQVVIASGQVTLNIAGAGKRQPLDLSGGGIVNMSRVPANFVINYAGTGELELSGQSDMYGVVYAPNADTDLSGQGDWFGSMVVGTLGMTGKAGVHIDRRLVQ